MSVSSNLLCSFELLKPLDSSALKSHIKKGRNQRNSAINSPVSTGCLSLEQNMLMISSLHNLQRKAFDCFGRSTFLLHESWSSKMYWPSAATA